MTGPQFLVLYVSLLGAAVFMAIILRSTLRVPAGQPGPEVDQLDPYQIAYLKGGERMAVAAAIASLAGRGLLRVDPRRRWMYAGGDQPDDLHPLEQAVHRAAWNGAPLRGIAQAHLRQPLDKIRSDLQGFGLVVTPSVANRAGCLPALILLGLAAIGLLRIIYGVSLHHAVGYLTLLTLLTGLIAFIFVVSRPSRTRRGDRVVRDLRSRYAALQTTVRTQPTSLAAPDLALAVAVFGPAILAGGPLADVSLGLTSYTGSGGSSGSYSCGGGGGGGGGCGGGGGGCGG